MDVAQGRYHTPSHERQIGAHGYKGWMTLLLSGW